MLTSGIQSTQWILKSRLSQDSSYAKIHRYPLNSWHIHPIYLLNPIGVMFNAGGYDVIKFKIFKDVFYYLERDSKYPIFLFRPNTWYKRKHFIETGHDP